ncbi:MAG: hypothetical protein IIB99_12080 [Planctomycetes bacterium]|nr:hypothetical protein [Planctomycetota bacterium]MCH8212094.1 hypothetical protein [Planctomycetota bacterium]MCH8259534.1 hypothetical protein [Planctomycetota bacterium]
MSNIDAKIKRALEATDTDLADEFDGDQSMTEMVFDVFRGTQKWLTFLAIFCSIVFMAASVFGIIQLFKAQELHEHILWGLGVMFCFSAVSLMKIWFWMQMNRNSILREIKRVELQVARLAAKLQG